MTFYIILELVAGTWKPYGEQKDWLMKYEPMLQRIAELRRENPKKKFKHEKRFF